MQFPSSYAGINPWFTAGKISGVGNCHATWRHQKTTICTSIGEYIKGDFSHFQIIPRVDYSVHQIHTRVSRGLRGQGVLDVTWKGADCNIFFLDLSNVLGPIFRSFRLHHCSASHRAKQPKMVCFASLPSFFKFVATQIIESFHVSDFKL